MTADQCCFAEYDCADTFLNTGYFNPVVTQQLKDHLRDPLTDVYFITGRRLPTCVDTYIKKFHDEGIDVVRDQIIFAAENASGEERTHVHLMKRPHYERLVRNYDRVIGFEDSRRNLAALYWTAVDFDAAFEGHLVLNDGATRQFTSNDIAEVSAQLALESAEYGLRCASRSNPPLRSRLHGNTK